MAYFLYFHIDRLRLYIALVIRTKRFLQHIKSNGNVVDPVRFIRRDGISLWILFHHAFIIIRISADPGGPGLPLFVNTGFFCFRSPIFIQKSSVKGHLCPFDLLLCADINFCKGSFCKFILMEIFLRSFPILKDQSLIRSLDISLLKRNAFLL